MNEQKIKLCLFLEKNVTPIIDIDYPYSKNVLRCYLFKGKYYEIHKNGIEFKNIIKYKKEPKFINEWKDLIYNKYSTKTYFV